MLITKVSQMSGKENTMDIDITIEQFERFNNRRETGELAQNILPNIGKGEREFLISGTTPEEWNFLFNPNHVM